MKKVVRVRLEYDVEVTVDESKFDEEFMEEFRESFFQFGHIDDHFRHLAQLRARNLVDNWSFIEGYGEPKDMGINFRVVSEEGDEEIIED